MKLTIPAVIATSANNITAHFENAERVYPCRCGETHRGEYAIYDLGHHECFHESPMIIERLAGAAGGGLDKHLVICPECGKSWQAIEAVCDV